MSSSHFMSCRAIIGELKWRLKKKLRRRISGKDFELLNERSPHHLSGAVRVSPATPFVDLDVEIDISWEDSATYRYSKLYFARYPEDYFSESQVICFRMKQNRCRQRIRLKLPDSAVKPGKIRFRFDPLPYSKGQACVYGCVLVPANDSDVQSCETAHIHALKQATRAAVVRSEEAQLSALPHYPESMSLELQPGCNFRCGHCATHGTPKAHASNNRLGEIELPILRALSEEVFPHLTLLHLVGRGEPLMVSDSLWDFLVKAAKRHQLLLTVVTNGYFIERRITEDVLPLIDTLTVSIDGLSPEVFAANRGGASLNKVLKGVQYFHEMRKAACLPRRPKLCLSWTLKKNNIAELPDFVRSMAKYEPDRYYMRHLLVCHDKDAPDSLLEVPEIANRYLAEAYRLIEKQGAETDCPPLFSTAAVPSRRPLSAASDTGKGHPTATDRDSICHYIHRTASIKAQGNVTTCGIYHAVTVGIFDRHNSFWSLWNGDLMQKLRRDINTPNEWNQCRNCWYRESRYRSQREKRAKFSAYSLLQESTFTERAWDYRQRKNE